ncbi:MAG: methylcrotonoyl-CoA carboxylase, partial [Steroidobacteraceae bacterium]
MDEILRSDIVASDAQFTANAHSMRALVEQLTERTAAAAAGGSAGARERHRARGKLLVRERIDLLLD